MVSRLSSRTVRSAAGHVRHALFPSRLAALVALTGEVGALFIGVPPAAHLTLAVVTHVAIAVGRTALRGRPRGRP